MSNNLNYKPNEKKQLSIDDVHPSVQNSIAKIAKQEGYINYHTDKKSISADGGNCFGELYEINIKGETKEGNIQKKNIFVKQIVPNIENLKLISVSEIYNKEMFIYTELAEIATELQDKANIPMTKRFKFVKIYNGSNEINNDALILENLTRQNFKTYGKFDVIDLRYAELCLEQLAKFHGLSFVIERKMPQYYTNKVKTKKQSLTTGTAYKQFASKVYIHSTRKFSSQLKIKTDKWWEIALENYTKGVQGKLKTVKCLCHGDFKPNNVMYKKTEEEITEVITIDYQLAHYGSPILDLIYFLFMGTEQKMRKNHLKHLKYYYHNSLSNFLDYFDVSVDDVYPKKEFEKDFENCIDYGLVSCICVMPFALNVEEGTPDFIDNDIVHIGLKYSDSYYDRLKGVFDDFFNL